MLQNYEYFLALARELNISRAARTLYISHQCLSRYLKNLEQECGVALFERKPSFTLTQEGQILHDTFLQIQRLEQNTLKELSELKSGTTGEVRLGITEGRLRILLPDLLERFQKQYPNILMKVVSNPSPEMVQSLLENKLDIVIAGPTVGSDPHLNYQTVLNEELYLVITDNLLRQYFPEEYPRCKEVFSHGADLRLFSRIPFILNYPGFASRNTLDAYLIKNQISLNIINEATQNDLQHLMAARDYAATVCLSMYVPSVQNLNQNNPVDNQLNIFPIKDLDTTHPLSMITVKGKYFPQYMKTLCKLIQEKCESFETIHL